MTPYEFWNQLVPGMWLFPAWVLLLVLTAFASLVFGLQVVRAAAGHRWPAMYIHLLKTGVFVGLAVYFLLNIAWRKIPPDDVPMGGFIRNPLGVLVTLVLIWEAIWRLGQDAERAALARIAESRLFLKGNP